MSRDRENCISVSQSLLHDRTPPQPTPPTLQKHAPKAPNVLRPSSCCGCGTVFCALFEVKRTPMPSTWLLCHTPPLPRSGSHCSVSASCHNRLPRTLHKRLAVGTLSELHFRPCWRGQMQSEFFCVRETMEEGKRQDEHDEESNEDGRKKKRNNTSELPWSEKDYSMTRENLTDKRWLLSRLPATLPMVFSLAGLLPWSLLIAGLSTYSFIIHKSNQNNRY